MTNINFSDENYNVFGGYLTDAMIGATGEIIIRNITGKVEREKE